MLTDCPVSAQIPVADLAAAKRYYSDNLGLKPGLEGPSVCVMECASGTNITLYETPHAGKANHTLAMWEVNDLASEMIDLRDRGITFEEYDMPNLKTVDGVIETEGMRAAWFKDLDGNILGMVEDARQ